MEYIVKKKKKKRLEMSLENIDFREHLETEKVIRERLRVIFRYHIGINNSILNRDLFESIYNINPDLLNIYKKKFWWDVIRNVLAQLRKENDLFVVIENNMLYTLQTMDEAKRFNKHIESLRKGLKEVEKKAISWVKNNKWKYI